MNKPIIHNYTEKSKIIVYRGMAGATGNLYCGLHEFSEMSFLLHVLNENDHFIDIGANIGSYTILASAHCKAETMSFEPHPKTFSYLEDNVTINKITDKVKLFNIALGSKKATLSLTNDYDSTNHIDISNKADAILVNVETLDFIVSENNFDPFIIKIDVEGFEKEVLDGASSVLDSPSLKVIIIELNGSGDMYGVDENEIHNLLLVKGFSPYYYNPLIRSINTQISKYCYNTIYIRDLDFVNKRIKESEKIKLNNILY